MNIELSNSDLSKINADAVMLGAYETSSTPTRMSTGMDPALQTLVGDFLQLNDFHGKVNEISVLYTQGKIPAARIVIIGLGKFEEFSSLNLRSTVASAFKKLRDLGCKTVGLSNFGSDSEKLTPADNAQVIIEGASLGSYRWQQNHTTHADHSEVDKIYFSVPKKNEWSAIALGVNAGQAISQGVYMARDLVNQSPNKLTPETLGKAAEKMANDAGILCTVHDLQWIEKQKMYAFLAVGQGSVNKPRFIELEYKGSKETPIVLIGKGITFDSGGVSIKPADGMEDMRTDMGGAAAVLGAIQAIASMKLPVHIIGLIAACENLPSGTAYRPADVITSRKGKTIEIISTDAEGRMTLADVLDYATTYKPKAVIDLATLTGACVVALGENVAAGYFTNDEMLSQKINVASKASDEKLWRLPLYLEYREKVKTDYADIKNTGGKNSGVGSSAVFLEEFTDYPWAHLDIAGMVLDKTGPVSIYPLTHPPYTIRGATGFGVRSLVSLIREGI